MQQLRARVAQLEEIRSRHARGSEEAAENIRTPVVVQKMFCRPEQDLACWMDDRQTEFQDALDMADMESASAITGQFRSTTVRQQFGECRGRQGDVVGHESVDSCSCERRQVGFERSASWRSQKPRTAPPPASPSRKFVGG